MRVEISKHARAFHRAHQHVIEQLGGAYKVLHSDNYNLKLQAGWERIHGVLVQREGVVGPWQCMEFKDEQHYVLWLMKWS